MKLLSPLAVLSVMRLYRATEKDVLDRLLLAGARIETITLDNDNDALAITSAPGKTNICLLDLVELPRLRYLCLNGKRLTDANLRSLGYLTSLKSLILADTDLSGTDLKALGSLRNLVCLSFMGSRVADTSLHALPRLASLSVLNLDHCRDITNASIAALIQMKSLVWLNIRGTKVTMAGVEQIRKALPGCMVFANGQR